MKGEGERYVVWGSSALNPVGVGVAAEVARPTAIAVVPVVVEVVVAAAATVPMTTVLPLTSILSLAPTAPTAAIGTGITRRMAISGAWM